MSISAKIAPHLPFLRRFGRTLTGGQASGDAYVVAVLESFLEDPTAFTDDQDMRLVLYQRLLSVWNSVDLNQLADRAPDPATRSLQSITPLPRQAFLLTAVEGFNTAQTAAILKCSSAEVASLIERAGREIADEVATNVLIIEDEPLIALDLEEIVKGLGHEVTRIVRTHSEAVAAVKERRPGLVLADVQLADGSSGLEAINEILQSMEVPVIFITAFPEKLLTGERPEPTFLVSKPFDPNMVRALISQALFFEMRAHPPGSAASRAHQVSH
jgi:CheY-like chemotaxis protein